MIALVARLHVLHADAGDARRRARRGSRSTVLSQTTSIFGLSSVRWAMIFEARNSSAAVDEPDLRRELREEVGLLHRGVAAADDGDLLAAEEEAVARGAGRDAVPLELLLAREAEVLRGGAGGDDERVARDLRAALEGEREGLRLRGRRRRRCRSRSRCRSASACLRVTSISSGPWMPCSKPGVVLDLGRRRELPAGLDALEDEGLEVRAGGVDGGGQARGARADDDDLVVALVRHVPRFGGGAPQSVEGRPDPVGGATSRGEVLLRLLPVGLHRLRRRASSRRGRPRRARATNWNAWRTRSVSSTERPTPRLLMVACWTTPSGSMTKRPRRATPPSSSRTP